MSINLRKMGYERGWLDIVVSI